MDLPEPMTLQVNLTITPGQVGVNTSSCGFRANGAPVCPSNSIAAFYPPVRPIIAPSERELIAQGDGTYTAKVPTLACRAVAGAGGGATG